MNKKLFVTFIFTFLFASLVLVKLVRSQDATGSAVSEDQVKEKTKELLEGVDDKDLEKTKEEMTKEASNKIYAWVGKVDSVNGETLVISTLEGLKTTNIATNADILKVIPNKPRTNIKPEDIKTGQSAICMGPKDDSEVILAKRIIIMDEAPVVIKREVISGKITEIDETKVSVKKNGDTVQLTIDSDVKLNIVGIKKPTTEDLQLNDYLYAIVLENDKSKITAVKAVLVVPGKANPQAKENEVTTATDSTQPKTSPSSQEE